ncbi:hypothetical protein LTR53_004381 [Teratosphaeriaceae sp. CCFEE 6253]|nr:hypothetical protein LTR53_004381 [Teratosphaeriaceae sp. CCFEE 6253]
MKSITAALGLVALSHAAVLESAFGRHSKHWSSHTVIDGVTMHAWGGPKETMIVEASDGSTLVIAADHKTTETWSNFIFPRATAAATCCFNINAYTSGGPGGAVGQLGDGQNRIGQKGLPQGKYCIDGSGGLTDANGRGCILTPPTTQ